MSRTAITPLALAAVLALAGCGSLVPPAGTPQPALPESFRATAPAAAPEAAAHEWDGFFADTRLRQVVGLALQGNRSLRASAEAVERVRALVRVSEAAVLPEIEATGGATRQRSGGNTSSSFSAGLAISNWELDLFGRLQSLEGAALARFEAQQDTQRAARLALVAETTNAWLTLAAARQQAQLAQALRDSQERTLTITQRQAALGAASGLQLARAQTAFEAARGAAAATATAATQTRLQLELLAGQPLPESLLPTGQDDAAATALPALPGGLPASVLLQRPDLRAAEQALQAAAFDVGAARAARFPRITLTAAAGVRSAELEGLGRSGSGFWSLAPSIDLPLFDAGLRHAQVEAASASQRAALASYEAALQAAFREVADALAVRDGLAERLAAQQAQVAAAARSLQLVERSQALGGSSQLELLDAQRQLAAAQQALVALRQAEAANRVGLLKALGGRWGGEAPVQPPG
jgi:NodT family efflux transporter outer membrane factor (OMF) lipoprotein